MIKKTITYTDYDGVERSEDFYFNLSKGELMEMNYSEVGGMAKLMEKIVQNKDDKRLFSVFKEILLKAYGEKSADGRRFIKSDELSVSFSQTEAYSELLMQLISDHKFATEFINGMMPKDLVEQVEKSRSVPEITVMSNN